MHILTHGVAPIRTYGMGAVLLGKNNPSRVLGRLHELMLSPTNARDGYVPNVVYSHGALLRDCELLLPFAAANEFTRFATVSIDAFPPAMAPD